MNYVATLKVAGSYSFVEMRMSATGADYSAYRTGDTFTFEVSRPTTATVNFAVPSGEQPGKFRLALAEDLANGAHVLKLIAAGDGPVVVEALDVFEPALR